jgi:hypothetical protein
MKPINLGKPSGCCGGPAEPVNMPVNKEMSYPSLYLNLGESEVEIPESGTMTITFSRKEKTERQTKEGEECSYTLDVKEITSISGSKGENQPARSFDRETKDALAKLRNAKKPEGEYEGEED